MGFHIGSNHAGFQNLYRQAGKRLKGLINKPRIPIAENARRAAPFQIDFTDITKASVSINPGDNSQTILTHTITSRVVARNSGVDEEFVFSFLNYFLPIYYFPTIEANFRKTPLGHIEISFFGVDDGISLKIFGSHLFVEVVASRGYGGNLLSTLYSFAKENGIKLIKFHVDKENLLAQGFYYHMDFGYPTSEDRMWGSWELPIT